jgi:nitrate reductase beta subunit
MMMRSYGLFPEYQEVPFMWTVIYIAPTAKIAERIKKRLTEEGFLVQTRPINMSKQQYEILVPSGELEEIQEVLSSILHS